MFSVCCQTSFMFPGGDTIDACSMAATVDDCGGAPAFADMVCDGASGHCAAERTVTGCCQVQGDQRAGCYEAPGLEFDGTCEAVCTILGIAGPCIGIPGGTCGSGTCAVN
jgi:hypothetical protein